jgi:hypothetical protein|tara:strand:+ start:235 stop:834 length:600 start_codon:yes stop_codon:yes gene_type:complete
MAFGISEFKSNLKGGGAKSALFQVDLNYPSLVTPPSVNAKFLISATSIPASTVGTYEVFYHGKSIKVAADRTYENWDTTIINDEDFGVRKSLEQWLSVLAKHELNTRSVTQTGNKEGKNAEYKADIGVNQYSKNGTLLQKYKFIGAFPIGLSTIALSWESNTIETYTCSWAYDCWEHQDLTTGEVITNVQSFTGTTTGF